MTVELRDDFPVVAGTGNAYVDFGQRQVIGSAYSGQAGNDAAAVLRLAEGFGTPSSPKVSAANVI